MLYSMPRLHEGKEWYVDFSAWDHFRERMRRKRYKLNHIAKKSDRRHYANELIKNLVRRLSTGWLPWMESEKGRAYCTFQEAREHFLRVQDRYLKDGIIRPATHTEYRSKLNNLAEHIEKNPIKYICQLDAEYLKMFVSTIYFDRGNSAQTHDNYLRCLNVFCRFLVDEGYHASNIAEKIKRFGRKARGKNRSVIPAAEMRRIYEYLSNENRYFLLACYVLHYGLIRPKEMSMLRLSDISLQRQTLAISGDISKNRRTAVVTLPDKVVNLMLDLKTFDNPDDYYLFSYDFKPGKERRLERNFRECWDKMKRKLKLPPEYKFYSLKDTGITNMLRSVDVLSVRDQARHSSIEMTNTYTPIDIKEANAQLKSYAGEF